MTRLIPRDQVGMVAPPPIIYAVPLVAGWLLQRYIPWSIAEAGSGATTGFVFMVCVIVGLAIAFSGVITFVRRSTPVIPLRPTTTIVRSGPYRFTRNPMYVGLTIVSAGIAIGMNTWWALILLPIAVLVIDRGVIAKEERYLRAKFGAEYDDFARHVRRWI
jgi:protein-S-isoprenylcysteine O-methyltransferase Ste14